MIIVLFADLQILCLIRKTLLSFSSALENSIQFASFKFRMIFPITLPPFYITPLFVWKRNVLDYLFHSLLLFQRFSIPPSIYVTARHQIVKRPQDALALWVEDVRRDSFKVCLRETKIFDGLHKNIKVVSEFLLLPVTCWKVDTRQPSGSSLAATYRGLCSSRTQLSLALYLCSLPTRKS